MAQQQEKLWTKDFILLAISNFFLFFGFQMLLPTLPMYIKQFGGSDTAVGLVIGIFTISALLIRPFAGTAVDTFGRKLFLFLGLIICLVAIGSYVLASSALIVLLLRIVHGFGWGITTTTNGTMVADIIPASRRGEGMGYFGMSNTLPMAVGPLAGILMINEWGFGSLFLLSFISTILALLLSQFISIKKERREKDKKQATVRPSLYEKKAFFPSLLAFFTTFTLGGIVGFITLYGIEIGIKNVGWFFSTFALFLLILRPISGVIHDKKGHQWVLIPGAIFGIISLLILSYTTTLAGLIVSAMFYGMSSGSIQPSLQAWMIDNVAPNRRGAANATFFSAFDLGISGGSILLGLIAGISNYAMMYRLSSIIFAIFLLVYVSYLYRVKLKTKAAINKQNESMPLSK